MQHRKALITADLHLIFNQIYVKNDGSLSLKLLEKLFDDINRIDPEYFFILGDVFHTKDTTSSTLLILFADFIKKVADSRKVILLVGNHDFSITATINSNLKYYHAFEEIQHPNITIVDDYFKLDEHNAFIPFCRTKEVFEKKLASILPAKRLFTHIDLNGFALGDDYIEKNVFLNIEDLEPFEQVISGHYHEPSRISKLISTRYLEMVYVGSPSTISFGESDQLKRYLLLDLDSGQWDSIDTGLTLHKTIKVNINDELPEIPLNEIENGIKYRLWVSGTKDEIDLWESRIPATYPTVTIKRDFIVKDQKRIELKSTDSRFDTVDKFTEEEIVRNYGGKEKTRFDLNRLKQIGRDYIKQ